MDDYRGYVNLTEAAHLIGVSTATLSRQRHVGVPLGGREVGLSPTDVLALADFFKRRPVSEVAGALVERAHKVGPSVADAVNDEVDRVLSAKAPREPSTSIDFLSEARRVLPRRLYAQVARFYRESSQPPTALGPAESPRRASTPRSATRAPMQLSRTGAREVSARASAESGALAQKV
jgi:hypothetical protein